MSGIDELENMVRETVHEQVEYAGGYDFVSYPDDMAHEIADGAVPVYYSDQLALAAEDNDLATDEPEIGPAFDGSPTPVNIIAANVYERLYAAAAEELAEIARQNDELDED